jgi:alpha-L-arabinofuranosidase
MAPTHVEAPIATLARPCRPPANGRQGKLRPDLLAALKGLAPPFIRWPGGSYASVYKWKDGIGPAVSRKYNPNTIWGGYSDYYGFGTDEFLELCRQLGAAPMIVLAATSTDPAQLEYALEWVHYLVDPPTTEWGRQRAANGHAEPYRVPYIQIDNHGKREADHDRRGPRRRELTRAARRPPAPGELAALRARHGVRAAAP